jgi:hypothetical protein
LRSGELVKSGYQDSVVVQDDCASPNLFVLPVPLMGV